jgi:hypothetical protein
VVSLFRTILSGILSEPLLGVVLAQSGAERHLTLAQFVNLIDHGEHPGAGTPEGRTAP